MLILKKFTQNNVGRKVNDFVKAHDKNLALKALGGSYRLQKSATKGKFLTPRNQRWRTFGVSYLLAQRVRFASTEG